MLSRSSLLSTIKPTIEALGLELFDVDLPSAKSGVLRVFICKPTRESDNSDGVLEPSSSDSESSRQVRERNGVTLDDCAAVSRALSDLEGFEDSLPAGVTLEVSSPGVNRRLRTELHFQGAIGEHIRIKRIDEDNNKSVITGTLLSFDGEILQFRQDGGDDVAAIPYADIDDARVEFLFQ